MKRLKGSKLQSAKKRTRSRLLGGIVPSGESIYRKELERENRRTAQLRKAVKERETALNERQTALKKQEALSKRLRAAFFGAVAWESSVLGLSVLVLFIAMLVVIAVAIPSLAVQKISDEFIWIRGVNKKFLHQLPQWNIS